MSDYVMRLCVEISRLPFAGGALSSVFIGGGTPSILPAGKIGCIMNAIHKKYTIEKDAEISIESNPETLDENRLLEYRASGINRISMGLQSLDNRVLRLSGRMHSAEDFWESFRTVRKAGFDNVNVDLIVGLPGQDRANMKDTLHDVMQAQPEHISLYSLILEKDTELMKRVCNGSVVLPDEDEILFMQRQSIAQLRNANYLRYEISNFSRPGFACKHNLHIWRYGEYLAAGLGASSALLNDEGALLRYRNETDLREYGHKIDRGQDVRYPEEKVEIEEQMFEYVMLGLRLTTGICNTDFLQRFHIPLEQKYNDAICANARKGYLSWDGERLCLTERGLEWQNQVLLDFMA